MRGKTKIKETVVKLCERECDGYFYTYRLLMSEGEGCPGFKIPLYSISVTMSGDDLDEREAFTGKLFSDAGEAIDFFEKAVRNLVTPIDLPYVVEDEFYHR